MGGHSYFSSRPGGSRITYARKGGSGGKCSSCCFPSSSPSTSNNGSFFEWSKKSTKAIVFQVIILILMLVYVLVLYFTYPKSGTKEISLGLSETRVVSISSVWYSSFGSGNAIFEDTSGVKEDRSSDVTLLKFNNYPPLTASDKWFYNGTVLNIDPRDYHYLSWYLYKGSSVTVFLPIKSPSYIYVIKGSKGFDRWNASKDFSNYLQDIYIPYSTTFIPFTVFADDFYFVVFDNTESYYRYKATLAYSITSVLLDTSKNVSSCTLPCTMDVKYSSSEVLVLHTPRVASYSAIGSPNSEFALYSRYNSRHWVVGLLFSIPLGTMFLFFILLMAVARKKDTKNSDHSRQESLNINEGGSSSSPFPSPSFPPSSSPNTYPPPSFTPDPNYYPPPTPDPTYYPPPTPYPSHYPTHDPNYNPPPTSYPAPYPPSTYAPYPSPYPGHYPNPNPDPALYSPPPFNPNINN